MSQSLIKILVHIVFSTKDRIDLIPLELESELYKYIHGILENNSARLIIAGGTANHIHLLISIGKTDVPTLIGDIKRSTSLWMKRKGVESSTGKKVMARFRSDNLRFRLCRCTSAIKRNITQSTTTSLNSAPFARSIRSRSTNVTPGIEKFVVFSDFMNARHSWSFASTQPQALISVAVGDQITIYPITSIAAHEGSET